MKYRLLLFTTAVFLLTSCSKKTHPNSSAKKNTESNTANANNPMIVIDGLGRVVTPQENLPVQVSYAGLARTFTPHEKANLVSKYKMLPPRILYVPEKLATKSLKGEYCVYKGKFWYWKKENGLFYLDETYYK